MVNSDSNVKDSSGNKTNVKDSSGNKTNVKDSSGNKVAATKQEDKTQFTDVFHTIFNKSNVVLILWFLGIYFILYFVLGFFFNRDGESSNFQLKLSRILDIIVFFIIFLVLISSYYSLSETKKENVIGDTLHGVEDYVNAPTSIFSSGLFLLGFYIVVYLFRIPMTRETKPIFISVVENIAWIFFVVILIVDFFKYILGISISDLFSGKRLWDKVPEKPLKMVDNSNNRIDNSNNVVKTSIPVQTNEVFNIANNLYTYDDAQSICTSYGAKLATYDQIEDAYNHGADWCNYGWSDKQMIFFPTQKSTWNKLQGTKTHKNDCGRPGINGGYIANPYMKFGVNCFGKKPKAKESDLAAMKAKPDIVVPKTKEELALETKVKFWKDNSDKLLKINSYNADKWSEF